MSLRWPTTSSAVPLAAVVGSSGRCPRGCRTRRAGSSRPGRVVDADVADAVDPLDRAATPIRAAPIGGHVHARRRRPTPTTSGAGVTGERRRRATAAASQCIASRDAPASSPSSGQRGDRGSAASGRVGRRWTTSPASKRWRDAHSRRRRPGGRRARRRRPCRRRCRGRSTRTRRPSVPSRPGSAAARRRSAGSRSKRRAARRARRRGVDPVAEPGRAPRAPTRR